jgi:hypothetical protein
MKPSRSWLAPAFTPIAIGAAAAVAVAAMSGSFGPPGASSRHAVERAWLTVAVRPVALSRESAGSGLPVVVNCQSKDQIRPASFVLACADGNSALLHLNWQTWQQPSAYGSGTWLINDCVPNCAQGTDHKYPALLVLWRPKPLPGKSGNYFTRLTMILTGPHCYTASGKRTCYPVTSTTDLWSPF